MSGIEKLIRRAGASLIVIAVMFLVNYYWWQGSGQAPLTLRRTVDGVVHHVGLGFTFVENPAVERGFDITIQPLVAIVFIVIVVAVSSVRTFFGRDKDYKQNRAY